MSWNEREILADEWGKALLNESQPHACTHKPSGLSEPQEVFEVRKKKN